LQQTVGMELLEAIYSRRATRSFLPEPVANETVRRLLDVAVQAPSAINAQPWRFVVIQDSDRLERYSERAKALLLQRMSGDDKSRQYADRLSSREFNIFYDASTLVVICGPANGAHAQADCWLAAQNLQLAAWALGLGTCCVGLAIPALNDSAVRIELELPHELAAIAPIVVGTPRSSPPVMPRAAPQVLSWFRQPTVGR
jgi:nitroreductase